MKISTSRRRKARIEMLPLIDIVFLLLVVFIYAMLSMAVHKGVPVQLPSSSTAELEKKTTLSVTVQKKGDTSVLFIDDQQVEPEEFPELLRKHAYSSGEKQKAVLLFADNAIPYDQVFAVLDMIRQAGLSNVSLQAEEKGAK